VAHFVSDEDDPKDKIARLHTRLPSGSAMALSHITHERQDPRIVQTIKDAYANATESIFFRGREQITGFVSGLQLVPPYPGAEPAVTYVGEWRADDPAAADSDGSRWGCCGGPWSPRQLPSTSSHQFPQPRRIRLPQSVGAGPPTTTALVRLTPLGSPRTSADSYSFTEVGRCRTQAEQRRPHLAADL